MRSRKTQALCLLAGSLLMAAMPKPGAADWLVTREGGKVETKGPWKVQGKRVIFTAKDGTLASLRLTEVDLDASKQATTAAEHAREERAAQAQAAPLPKKSVRVLTDKDFPKPPPPAPEGDAAATSGAAAPGGTTAPPSNGALQVATWKQERDTERDLMKISGRVRNAGPDLATAVQVIIQLFDDGGRVIATQQASLDTRTLQSGQDTSFQVDIPGVTGFASAKFDTRSTPLVKRPPPPEEGTQNPEETSEEDPPSR